MNATLKSNIDIRKIEKEYNEFILTENHPCVMAKSLFKMKKYDLKVYDSMNDPEDLQQLVKDLENYIEQYNFKNTEFKSFIASFPNDKFSNEIDFEKALWTTLQKLNEIDDCEWDHRVSDNPNDKEFSFSLGGRAFYIVGLHPQSSRIARQAPHTTMVFNLHHQFEKLRNMGTFLTVRDTIRKNDEILQGTINPVLRDYGADTETKQYSGRKVEENWKCPFHNTKK